MTSASREQETRAFLAQLETIEKIREVEGEAAAQLARDSFEAYKYGRRNHRGEAFRPMERSADSAIYESQQLMNARVRSEEANNSKVKRIIDAIVNLTVGAGVQTFADPFDPLMDLSSFSNSDQIDWHLKYALESDLVFSRWFESTEFDFAGKRTGPDTQRLLVRECAQTGDAFLLKCYRNRRGKVGLCYQIIEREQLDNTQDRPAGEGVNKIINGIEIDADGREVAFYVLDAHPFDDFTMQARVGKSSRISADRMIHLCLFHRPSQNIGVAWIHAIGLDCYTRQKFISAELQTAAKAALMLLVNKSKNLNGSAGSLGLDDGGPAEDCYGNPTMKLGTSTYAFQVGKDDDVEMIESNRPNSGCEPFIKILDHDIALGTGVNYYTLSGRYDQTNFSSVRAAKLDEDDNFLPIKNWFARLVALPIRKKFHAQAIAMGMITSVSASQFMRNPERYMQFDALAGGRELLAPKEETEAAAGRCRAGFSNLKIECAKRNLHWIRVLRQLAIEKRLCGVLDVVVDFSKGQGGQVDTTTTAPSNTGERY